MRNLKWIQTILIILMTNTPSFSQALSDSIKFEIGIGIPNLPATIIKLNYAPVISFKAIYNKNALRVGLIYDLAAPRPLKDHILLLINSGYERRFFLKKSKLLLGVDVCYLYRFHQDNSNPQINSTFYHFGIGPVLGYKYRFSKKFSFQTELGFYYGYGKEKYFNNGVYNTFGNVGYYTGHRFLSLNLFYHF